MSPPQNVTVEPGRMAILSPGEGAAALTWHNPTEILDPDALDCDESTLRMCVVPRKPGRYAIGATVRADLTQWWIIDAGEAVKPAPSRSFAWVGAGVLAVGKAVKAVVASPRLQGAVLAVALAVGGVTVKGCLPPVGPVDPSPIVDPVKPAPVTKIEKAYVVVCEDTAQRTPAEGKAILDLEAKIVAKGHKFASVSVKDPEFKQSGYDVATAAVGLPAVIVFDTSAMGAPVAVLKVDPAKLGEDVGRFVK